MKSISYGRRSLLPHSFPDDHLADTLVWVLSGTAVATFTFAVTSLWAAIGGGALVPLLRAFLP